MPQRFADNRGTLVVKNARDFEPPTTSFKIYLSSLASHSYFTMSSDSKYTELRDTLWYALACRCQECGAELELDELERLKERDAMAWSRVAAERALEQGWQPIRDEIAVRCPTCCAARN